MLPHEPPKTCHRSICKCLRICRSCTTWSSAGQQQSRQQSMYQLDALRCAAPSPCRRSGPRWCCPLARTQACSCLQRHAMIRRGSAPCPAWDMRTGATLVKQDDPIDVRVEPSRAGHAEVVQHSASPTDARPYQDPVRLTPCHPCRLQGFMDSAIPGQYCISAEDALRHATSPTLHERRPRACRLVCRIVRPRPCVCT